MADFDTVFFQQLQGFGRILELQSLVAAIKTDCQPGLLRGRRSKAIINIYDIQGGFDITSGFRLQ